MREAVGGVQPRQPDVLTSICYLTLAHFISPRSQPLDFAKQKWYFSICPLCFSSSGYSVDLPLLINVEFYL